MKLRRFYESVETKPWSEREFFDFFDRKEIIDDEYIELKKLAKHYLNLNSDLIPEYHKGYDLRNRYVIGDIFLDDEINVNIEVQNSWMQGKNSSYDIILNNGLTEDFITFLENPEAYENTKKYNL